MDPQRRSRQNNKVKSKRTKTYFVERITFESLENQLTSPTNQFWMESGETWRSGAAPAPARRAVASLQRKVKRQSERPMQVQVLMKTKTSKQWVHRKFWVPSDEQSCMSAASNWWKKLSQLTIKSKKVGRRQFYVCHLFGRFATSSIAVKHIGAW